MDKEFLQISSNDLRGKKIIKNVINMCKDLKLEVIAEGVETKAQIDFLTSSGCQIAQGYYYTHPLPAPEFYDFALSYFSDRMRWLNSHLIRPLNHLMAITRLNLMALAIFLLRVLWKDRVPFISPEDE
jgi:hypothetical protein